jgi:hypothetical protein
MCLQNTDKAKKSDCNVEELNPPDDFSTDTCSLKKESTGNYEKKGSDKISSIERSSQREKKEINVRSSERSHKSMISQREIEIGIKTEKLDKTNSMQHEFILQRVNTFGQDRDEAEEKLADVLSPKFNECDKYFSISENRTSENTNLANFQPSTMRSESESSRHRFFKFEMEKIEKMTSLNCHSRESQRGLLFTNQSVHEDVVSFTTRFNTKNINNFLKLA